MVQLLMRRPHLRDLPTVRPLPAGYRLRAYRAPDDLATLNATLQEAFAEPWDESRARRELLDVPGVKAIYVIEHEGAVVGTTSSKIVPDLFPGSGYVHWVAVADAHLRRGLAAILLNRVLQDFIERGHRDAVLETDDQRLPAISAYLRFGFLPSYDVRGEDHRARWSAIFQALFGR
ncbi:MAG TPA: GNAT family N-acetyltransferase [Thermomicrobiales bacterium]|jgi:mycothiol synthase